MSRFDFDPATFTWRCDICGEERPDARISVHKVDIGVLSLNGHRPLPPGTMIRNVKYCNDEASCIEGAKNWDEAKYTDRMRGATI